MITEGDRGRTGTTDFGEHAQKNAPKTDYSAQPEPGGLIIGPQKNIILEHSQTTDRLGYKVGASEMDQHPEVPLTEASIQINAGYGNTETFRGEFGHVQWRGHKDSAPENVITTHPNLIREVLLKGPAALEAYAQEHGTTTVRSVAIAGDKLDLQKFRTLHTFTVDAEQGLIILHRPKPVEGINVKEDVVVQDEVACSDYRNAPQNLYSSAEPMKYRSPLYQQLDQKDQRFTNFFERLGYSANTFMAESYTIPLGGELVSRMQFLRENDDPTEFFVPGVELHQAGMVDDQLFLETYADYIRHSIGTESFYFLAHDSGEYHILPFMVYGHMFMDFVSQYAQVGLKKDKTTFTTTAYTIDKFTNEMGVTPIPVTPEEEQTFQPKQLRPMLESLEAAERVDDLQIVQWMRERGMVDAQTAITEKQLKDGFVTYAKGRFKIT